MERNNLDSGRKPDGKFAKGNKIAEGNEGGRPKCIESPELMWELFKRYLDEVKNNPIYIIEQRRSSVNLKITPGADVKNLKKEIAEVSKGTVALPIQRPLTMEGFENFLFKEDVITDVSDYFENKENRYSEFVPICTRVKKMIRQDQIEGGLTNIYNANITARLNGLKESSEVEQKNTNINYDLTNLTDGEKQQLFELSLKIKNED